MHKTVAVNFVRGSFESYAFILGFYGAPLWQQVVVILMDVCLFKYIVLVDHCLQLLSPLIR